MSKIGLNGNDYALTGDVSQGYVEELSTAFRSVGTQRRQDNQKVNRYPTEEGFPLGIGYQRMNRENGHGVGGMAFSTAQTRWPTISLGYLHEAETHASDADHFVKAVTFKGGLRRLEHRYPGA